MGFDQATQRRVFHRTDGRCGLCSKRLAWCNYGRPGRRGAWEIDHSRPRAKGGTDHGNNLFATCVACNRSKGARSGRTERQRNGLGAPPRSTTQKTRDRRWSAGTWAAAAALLVPPHIRIPATAGAAILGYWLDNDE